MRVTRPRKILAVAIAGVAAAAMQAAPAQADTTETTFTISGGSVSITTAPATAALATVDSGSLALTGSLGDVTVTDERGALGIGWAVTAETTDFVTDADGDQVVDDGESVSEASVLYTSVVDVLATDGVVTPVPGVGVAIADAATVMSGTVVVGNNSVTWDPTIAITIPANAVSGVYEGTITHSMA